MDLEQLKLNQAKAVPISELGTLADEIRQFLIQNISKTGGHIGPNLGTVDLTIALHYTFDSPKDRILWDTGHQGYTHKILTGRAKWFPTLNTYGGMNRFVTRTESEHDVIEASHAGTSISVALGLALAKRLKGEQDYVVAVIGDGSLSEGLALEALNHTAAERGIHLILVLNDNGFAISPGFGALHNYLQSRGVGDNRPETLFTSLGLEYLGPVDGHNIEQMLEAFEQAKQSESVPLVHVKTIKGYGFPPADGHPYRCHFSFPFDPETGEGKEGYAVTGYQETAARVIGEEMARDERIVAITPSTLYATGLQPVFDRFPDRCFDPGMSEQHAMTLTVGFALEGYKPVVFYQSTFMQRAFDQLLRDVCFTNLPTLLVTAATGFSGDGSPTRHGIYDFAYLNALPNLRIMYPKDRYELERMLRDRLRDLRGPTLLGMPDGPSDHLDEGVLDEALVSFGRARVMKTGKDMLMIAVGSRYQAAYDAVGRLSDKSLECGLVNLRYLKPLPEEQLACLMAEVPRVISVEEGVLAGSVGSALASLITDRNLKCELLRIGIPDRYVEPGTRDQLCRIYELDGQGIYTQIALRWFRP